MNKAVSSFKTESITAFPTERFQIVKRLCYRNKNEQIKNLLYGLNTNDVSVRNSRREDSIYWVCSKLLAFQDFS
jgi:hypothetical protein